MPARAGFRCCLRAFFADVHSQALRTLASDEPQRARVALERPRHQLTDQKLGDMDPFAVHART
ncbi:MAG: hypothetical protein AVDCRST_MAG34-1200 [uncultured Nocardioidaceae bacterium]|uniref:Uncharacterized protein n=1 Tax=uncultured Nocardioidaceae bacterium TaxID=253824 RepID=A0A6J4LYG9_9ACTN|nr:MAG: hypothetical protein AVDCRST_MAG34-1200 [uncultured Nocardioidaceae bacterium]